MGLMAPEKDISRENSEGPPTLLVGAGRRRLAASRPGRGRRLELVKFVHSVPHQHGDVLPGRVAQPGTGPAQRLLLHYAIDLSHEVGLLGPARRRRARAGGVPMSMVDYVLAGGGD